VRISGDLKRTLSDPLQREIDLPFQRAYYPFGFRLDLASNSRDVLDAAEENWGMYEPEYDDSPLTVRVLVQPGNELSPQPVHRLQGHLYSAVASRENYALIDLDALFAYAWVTERTVADHAWFRWFYLELLAGTTLAQRHAVPMHAACLERNGVGVLLWGPSGMGKSTLAYACARAGWTFVADDSTILPQNRCDCVVTGKPHQARFREDAPRLFPEFDGYVTRARPTGKLSIEVPMASFAGIRTAVRCEVKRMVFLDRGKGGGLDNIGVDSALEQMMQDSRSYGEETQARHERALRRLLHAPMYRLKYERSQDAIEALESLTA
jgi:HPr Serine kinase C-terminal domain